MNFFLHSPALLCNLHPRDPRCSFASPIIRHSYRALATLQTPYTIVSTFAVNVAILDEFLHVD